MYTTASVFFKTLADAGVSHAFVNWGSDHPAFLEDLQRQRAENDGRTLIEIVTCPSEYVALSAAHGYAQVTRKPAAVIVHVDVGTQALAGAIHNADRGQIPVLIFAGAAPFSANGEFKGSRNEFMMWLQDAHDQPAIVRQYMRYTAQIQSGKTASRQIMRALQIATSQPKGPVYLWARREATEEDVDEATVATTVSPTSWPSITMPALSPHAVDTISSALLNADFPLIIAANAGRNPATVPLLSQLASKLAIGVLSVASPSVCIPGNHPCYLGYVFIGKPPHLEDADVVLLLDVDVPWTDVADTEPRTAARIFVVDNDPLKRTFGWSHVDAEMLCTAEAETALTQLLDVLDTTDAQSALSSPVLEAKLLARQSRLDTIRSERLADLSAAEARLAPDGRTLSVPYIVAALRDTANTVTPSRGSKVLWLTESGTSNRFIWNHINPEQPGSMLMSGGTSLGWILGASIGASIGAKVADKGTELIISITGDGNFFFGVPTAAYWIARRYGTPFLTIVLNNRGWASPIASMKGVYPEGIGSRVSGERLSVGFGVPSADFGGIAAAAGGAWARKVERADEVRSVFEQAMKVVMDERRCAVVECVIQSI
ncbi:thiamine diphosphate-binding protein [Dichomitus squalens]|uniref:Thiamine diphosphate-binding protein n=1 Tax=Dichomitus squalens TaxID=114155 RepID=A0A4Q9NVQ0_9APHY|nr:thiamine diphosphate-binding protein [Dichomitus squalens]TBU54838.1 thiamine diphosphate-binding protein [Dichomitus squalens]